MAEKTASVQNLQTKRQKLDMTTLKRLLSYMGEYKKTLVLVVVCIFVSAAASAASSMFLQTLIDDYIAPLLLADSPVFTGLLKMLAVMAVIYLAGTLATWIYNRLMVTIAQGTLKKIRDDMFSKMQRLPVRYFDTHTFGDTMSLYTNDTDTLRQMIAQSFSQLITSVFTIVAVFFCMLYISVWLTLVGCVVMCGILFIVKKHVAKSGKYFMLQQSAMNRNPKMGSTNATRPGKNIRPKHTLTPTP